MKINIKQALLLLSFSASCMILPAQDKEAYRDIYPDTWVATDALGRIMPDYEEVGPRKNDQRRVVGIFYITWHADSHHNIPGTRMNVTEILEKDPSARLDGKHPLWNNSSFHWGEPEMGYFLSKDEYVIRKDISMLADAGVDVLVMDVTNAVRYWSEWDVLFNTMLDMRKNGNKVPQFCFWSYNGPAIEVVQDLYEKVYKVGKYKDLWFYWDDKPLLLYNAHPEFDSGGKAPKSKNPNYSSIAANNPASMHYGDPDYALEYYEDYTKEVKEFFTLRNMWWGRYMWGGERFVGTEGNWSFGYELGDEPIPGEPMGLARDSLRPDQLISPYNGKPEQAAITPAQHSILNVGKSWTRKNRQPKLNEYDMPVPTYVPWLGKTVDDPTAYGIYFQERWDETLPANPHFIYINDWNEWTAGKYQREDGGPANFLGRKSNFWFVDQYNAEFNRTIQPMKDGYTDNYYMQMAQNIRRYKGVAPIPKNKGFNPINMGNGFNDWNKIETEFRDTQGDVFHRDYNGYNGLHYTNTSGRNDFLTSKVSVDKGNIYFFAQTDNAISPYTDKHWMMLFIDKDANTQTGWYGYDFAVNMKVKSDRVTTLMKYDNGQWIEVCDLNYYVDGNKIEIEIPREKLNLDKNEFTFDFKWSDNAGELKDPMSFCIDGDTAPNRRFNYRYIWKK